MIKSQKEIAIELKSITKTYPGVVANDNVDFKVFKGEIHALVGENGAGKSTLVKILYGIEQPDSGEIYVEGSNVKINKVDRAIELGIGMVHQEFHLVPSFTAAENIGLGDEPKTKIGFIDWEKLNQDVSEIAKKYGLDLDPTLKMIDASVGTQQRTEILKTLYRNASILILDEPTAVLTPQETDELFEVIRSLVNEGKTVIFITHKLREVMEISDRVTVMRDGKVQGVTETKQTSPAELAKLMVGREVFLKVDKTDADPKDVVLELKNFWVHDSRGLLAIKNLNMEVKKGEIVGIAGVDGNGQTELVEALAGLRSTSKGEIIFEGKNIEKLSPRKRRRLGLSHIPEDRGNTGLNLRLDIWENLIGTSYFRKPLSISGIISMKNVVKHSKNLKESYDIRTPGVFIKVQSLSGGNQQKVVIARELSENPTLTIASQPTRGVDIGNIEAIHKKLVEIRDEGKAVLLISAELDEVMSVADRVAVIYEGEIVAWVNPKEVNQEQMGLYMAGIKD
ncbi:MAG: ABC transporter ATP-binding protein [Candidatus Actinomarina sp.]